MATECVFALAELDSGFLDSEVLVVGHDGRRAAGREAGPVPVGGAA